MKGRPRIVRRRSSWNPDIGGLETALREDLLKHVKKYYIAIKGMTHSLVEAPKR